MHDAGLRDELRDAGGIGALPVEQVGLGRPALAADVAAIGRFDERRRSRRRRPASRDEMSPRVRSRVELMRVSVLTRAVPSSAARSVAHGNSRAFAAQRMPAQLGERIERAERVVRLDFAAQQLRRTARSARRLPRRRSRATSSLSIDAVAVVIAQASPEKRIAAMRSPAQTSSMRSESPHSGLTPSAACVQPSSAPRLRGLLVVIEHDCL